MLTLLVALIVLKTTQWRRKPPFLPRPKLSRFPREPRNTFKQSATILAMSSTIQNQAEALGQMPTVQEPPPVQAPARGPRGPAPITWKVLVLCAYASFGGILFGYDSGYINGVLGMKQFKKDFGHGGVSEIPEQDSRLFQISIPLL